MTEAVEAFVFRQKQKASAEVSEICVYGVPMHREPAGVIAFYKERSLEDFLAHEARHGIGNYLLVDSGEHGCRVITSTAYCGGYVRHGEDEVVAGTLLSSVLSADAAFDPFGLCFYLTPYPKSAFSQMPITTVFEDVYRIPPASVFEFRNGAQVTGYSYLLAGRDLDPSPSFASAISEVTEALATHYKANGVKPALLFSGGVDSLVIYLALAQKMDPKDIRAITLETAIGRSVANGQQRAFPVARRAGFEIEILPDNSLHSPAVTGAVREMLRHDMIGSLAPHLALADHDVRADILHGQNMDATVMNGMDAKQFNKERGYLTDAILPFVTEEKESGQYRTFIENLQFTQAYLGDVEFQRSTAKSFATWHNGIPDPSPGKEGIVRGLLSSQFPNILPALIYPASLCSMVGALDREVALYASFSGKRSFEPGQVADVARYYTYSHLAAKRLTTFPLPDGSRTQLLAMAGPITTYFIGRPKGLLEASRPKHELYAFVRKVTGMPYSQLAAIGAVDRAALSEFDKSARESTDMLLQAALESLGPDNSRVLDAVRDARIKSHVAKVYRQVLGREGNAADPDRVRQFLGLELLLSEASKGSR